MFNNDQISSVVWFGFGLMVIFASLPYGLGGIHSPGTGFLPFLTGIAICALSAIGFLDAALEKRKGKTWENFLQGLRWHKPLITLTVLVAYVFILERLGFLLTTTLLVGFLLRVIEPQRWTVVIAGSLLTASAMYLIFQVLLKTQLPMGILNF
ncbi:MAG: tripartite tricarboxylate transporter TctB family protein [Pseudomonadota bacterium]